MDRDSLVLQCTIRDLQSALRTETICADQQTDQVARLTDQVARLAEEVARLAEQVVRLGEPERQPAASQFAALPPSELTPTQRSDRPSKRHKAV